MSMQTPREWHHSSEMNISVASTAQCSAMKQIGDSRKAHDKTVSNNLDMYNELHRSLDQKVKTSYRLVQTLQQLAQSLRQSIEQSKFSLDSLQAAFQAKSVPLHLCMWRLEQRENRPLREQVRDSVEVALEDQKVQLMKTQHCISEAMRKTTQVISLLHGKLDEVSADIEQKTQALSLDEVCLRSTHRSWQTVLERSAVSSVSSCRRAQSAGRRRLTPSETAHFVGNKNEMQRQQDVSRLSQRAAICEQDAKDLRDENGKLMSSCERVVEETIKKSECMMQQRINENQRMRKRLGIEVQEMHARILHTKRIVEDTRTQIRALDEPIELTSSCASWRKQRAPREHIIDPVSARLSQHQGLLLKSHEELREYNRSERTILQDLVERLDHLKEDFRDKTLSLHIDLNCLSHNVAVMNGKLGQSMSRRRASRAMKVDPDFVPMPSVGRPSTAR